jgi:hypothetical protein
METLMIIIGCLLAFFAFIGAGAFIMAITFKMISAIFGFVFGE